MVAGPLKFRLSETFHPCTERFFVGVNHTFSQRFVTYTCSIVDIQAVIIQRYMTWKVAL